MNLYEYVNVGFYFFMGFWWILNINIHIQPRHLGLRELRSRLHLLNIAEILPKKNPGRNAQKVNGFFRFLYIKGGI